jgi:hypothetical protein
VQVLLPHFIYSAGGVVGWWWRGAVWNQSFMAVDVEHSECHPFLTRCLAVRCVVGGCCLVTFLSLQCDKLLKKISTNSVTAGHISPCLSSSSLQLFSEDAES